MDASRLGTQPQKVAVLGEHDPDHGRLGAREGLT